MSWHGIIGTGTYWPTAADYLIWGLIIDLSWLIVYAVSPWQSSRHLMAKNEHVVLRAAILACLVVALLQVMASLVSAAVLMLGELGESDLFFFWLIGQAFLCAALFLLSLRERSELFDGQLQALSLVKRFSFVALGVAWGGVPGALAMLLIVPYMGDARADALDGMLERHRDLTRA